MKKNILQVIVVIFAMFCMVGILLMSLNEQTLSGDKLLVMNLGMGAMSVVFLYFAYHEFQHARDGDIPASARLVSGVRVPMYIGASCLFVYWIFSGV